MDRDASNLILVCGLALTLVVLWSWKLQPMHGEATATDRPIEVEQDGYVHSDSCRSCHPDQYASWGASFHKTMTQRASSKSVLGDFDGTKLTLFGDVLDLSRDGERFLVSQNGLPPRPVVMTTGSHHMQVYWLPAAGPDRTVEPMPFVWLLDEQRWIPSNSSSSSRRWRARTRRRGAGTRTASAATPPTGFPKSPTRGSTPRSVSWASRARPATAPAPSTSPPTAPPPAATSSTSGRTTATPRW